MDPSACAGKEPEKSPKVKPGAVPVKTTKKLWLVENVEHHQSEKPQVLPVSNSEWIDQNGDEFWPLSGKPYFSVVIAKTHIKPAYHLYLPNKMLPYLPPNPAPVVLTFRGKSWEMEYNADRNNKAFDSKWRKFANDNDLKLGDACIFELMESNPALKFRVQILRGDFPAELLERDGNNSDRV
ncbi:B3 domain-containing protein Os04g0386900-like isoform X2 [Diospyros lotus]|uniref:B3 domain-containing protein Os04g0386900-like isoform X2 n=1 Tax=Diospyros lotus TaxID=55363 RepID=UPI00224E23C3|nr:B3 domain-containing protein Os04g0386900-like isoform X2 [Diospyros lotus]